VCSGVKSILDVAASLERLETLNVGVVGYRTDRFPGFYLTDSGHRLEFRVESAQEVAAVLAARRTLRMASALVVANPLPSGQALDPGLHDRLLTEGLAAADAASVSGKDVTPFLLEWFHRHSAGASQAANTAIILANASLAGQIAAASAPAPIPA